MKVSKREMIVRALNDIPGQKGTKNEIFMKIEQMYSVNLSNKQGSQFKTLEQALCKYFSKVP